MPQQIPDEARLFEAALDCPSAELRAAFLDKACAGQPELRQRLERLLAAHDHAGSFLEPPLPGGTARVKFPLEEKPGDTIGNYKLREQIGEGGFGVVFVADQETPVRRRVAIKVVKLGMDTKQVIARFEAERQVLALMDHPNIAKVLDAGSTRNGRPYFVMELVRGVKITDYCDQNNLATEERLKLFIQVCQAVQHAHQKGIIHRDIKPSNILVTLHDGVPVPKVIDFGIAKATNNQQLTDKTIYTAFEQFMGTPAYMSPEQAEMSGLDIDTRSDIYSLGVLLYELLTGKTPFDPNTLLQAGIDQMRRIIREEEPARPSLCLKTLSNADLSTAAHRRQTEPPRLINKIRGDLDWIVMKSLEKDRTRRYESASSLALEIRKHLEQEPVEARPPSQFYRLQKMFLRNKLAFGATSGIVLALLLGLSAAVWFLHREKTAVERALTAEKALNRAQQEAAALVLYNKSRAGSDDSYYNPVWFAESLQYARQALAIQTNLFGETNKAVEATIDQLILILSCAQGDEKVHAELNSLVLRDLQIKKALRGSESEYVANWTLEHLVNLTSPEDVTRLFEKSIQIKKGLTGPLNGDIDVMGDLVNAFYLFNMPAPEKEKIMDQLFALWKKHPDVPRNIKHVDEIGESLMQDRQFAEAESFYRKVMDLGYDETENLAEALLKQKKFKEAEPLLRNAFKASPLSFMILSKLIYVLNVQGKTNETDTFFNQNPEAFKPAFKSFRQDPGSLPDEVQNTIKYFDELDKDGHDGAINFVTRLSALDLPARDKSNLLFKRAVYHAMANQMLEASQDFSESLKFITNQPSLADDTSIWDNLAFTLAASGKLAAYENLLPAYAAFIVRTQDMGINCADPSVFLLFPGSTTNLDMARLLVDKLEKEQESSKGSKAHSYMHASFYKFTKALLHYRQGKYATAIEFAQQALDEDTKPKNTNAINPQSGLPVTAASYAPVANAYQVMAMAQYRLGNSAPAQQALNKAMNLEKQRPSFFFQERIMTRILFQEAEGLMGHEKTAAAPAK